MKLITMLRLGNYVVTGKFERVDDTTVRSVFFFEHTFSLLLMFIVVVVGHRIAVVDLDAILQRYA